MINVLINNGPVLITSTQVHDEAMILEDEAIVSIVMAISENYERIDTGTIVNQPSGTTSVPK